MKFLQQIQRQEETLAQDQAWYLSALRRWKHGGLGYKSNEFQDGMGRNLAVRVTNKPFRRQELCQLWNQWTSGVLVCKMGLRSTQSSQFNFNFVLSAFLKIAELEQFHSIPQNRLVLLLRLQPSHIVRRPDVTLHVVFH